MVVHAGFEANLAVRDERVRGHGDDGQGLEARVGPQDARRLDAVHDRHLHVHEHDVIVVLAHHAHRFGAVLGEIDEDLRLLELADGDFLIDLVVLDQEHARPAYALDIEGEAGLHGFGRLKIGAERADGRVEQDGGGHRLDQHVLEAALLRLLQHLLAAIRRHHDKMRRGVEVGQRQDAPAGLDAVQPGHLPIDEGDVVGLPRQRRLPHHLDAFLTGRRLIGDEAQIGEHARQNAAGLRIVVDDQNAPAPQVRLKDAPPRRHLVPCRGAR